MKQRSILGEHLCTTIQGHLEPARGFGLSSARVRLLSFTRLRDPPDTMLTHGVAAVVRTAQSVVKRAALTSALRRAAIISSTSEEPNVRRCSLVAHSPVRAYWAAQRMPAGGLESCLLHARRFSVQKAEARVGDGYEKGQVDSSTELAIQVDARLACVQSSHSHVTCVQSSHSHVTRGFSGLKYLHRHHSGTTATTRWLGSLASSRFCKLLALLNVRWLIVDVESAHAQDGVLMYGDGRCTSMKTAGASRVSPWRSRVGRVCLMRCNPLSLTWLSTT